MLAKYKRVQRAYYFFSLNTGIYVLYMPCAKNIYSHAYILLEQTYNVKIERVCSL